MLLRAICFLNPGLHSGLGRSISFVRTTRPLSFFECSCIFNAAWNFASLIRFKGNFNCLLEDFSVNTSLGTELGMPAFLGTSFRGVDLGTIWSCNSEFVSKLWYTDSGKGGCSSSFWSETGDLVRFVSGVLGLRLLCTSNELLPPGWLGVIRNVLIS